MKIEKYFLCLISVLMHSTNNSVIKQSGACARGTLMDDPTISVEGHRFLLTGFQPWGCWEHSCSDLYSYTIPSISLLPTRLQAKNMPKSSPYPYLFLSQLCKLVSIPSVKYAGGFQSHHPLATALSFRIWGMFFSASV